MGRPEFLSHSCHSNFRIWRVIADILRFESLTKCVQCGLFGDAPVAQLDRALPSGGKGQRFESSRARHFQVILLKELNGLKQPCFINPVQYASHTCIPECRDQGYRLSASQVKTN